LNESRLKTLLSRSCPRVPWPTNSLWFQRADVTFTLTPKNESDVVAGAALVQPRAGGFVSSLERTTLTANRRDPLLSGLLASGHFLKDPILALVEPHLRVIEPSR